MESARVYLYYLRSIKQSERGGVGDGGGEEEQQQQQFKQNTHYTKAS